MRSAKAFKTIQDLTRAGQTATRLGLYFRHITTDIVITPTAEGAKGACYLLLFNAKTAPATLTEAAIYDDTIVKTPAGWRFTNASCGTTTISRPLNRSFCRSQRARALTLGCRLAFIRGWPASRN